MGTTRVQGKYCTDGTYKIEDRMTFCQNMRGVSLLKVQFCDPEHGCATPYGYHDPSGCVNTDPCHSGHGSGYCRCGNKYGTAVLTRLWESPIESPDDPETALRAVAVTCNYLYFSTSLEGNLDPKFYRVDKCKVINKFKLDDSDLEQITIPSSLCIPDDYLIWELQPVCLGGREYLIVSLVGTDTFDDTVSPPVPVYSPFILLLLDVDCGTFKTLVGPKSPYPAGLKQNHFIGASPVIFKDYAYFITQSDFLYRIGSLIISSPTSLADLLAQLNMNSGAGVVRVSLCDLTKYVDDCKYIPQFEVVVGEPIKYRQGLKHVCIPALKGNMPSGFGNPFAQYIWRADEHCDWLYMGTYNNQYIMIERFGDIIEQLPFYEYLIKTPEGEGILILVTLIIATIAFDQVQSILPLTEEQILSSLTGQSVSELSELSDLAETKEEK
jgi:hypothetical protein